MVMSKQHNIANRVRKIVYDHLEVEHEHLTNCAKLRDELSADSLDVVEVSLVLEDAFEIEITDEDIAKVETVDDLIAMIERLTGQDHPAA